MPLFPNDFKKFKHLSSDDETTTLQHPGGHRIVIAHKSLSPAMRKQLEAIPRDESKEDKKEMAEGGYAEAAKSGKLGSGPKVAAEVEEKKAPKPDPTKREDIQGADSPHQKSAQEKFDAYMKSQPSDKEDPRPGDMAHGGEVCYACGGKVHMAEGGEAMPAPPKQVSEETQLDPDMARKRQIYNTLVQSGTVPLPNDVMPGPPEQQMFGQKGEEPKAFNPQTWANSEQMFQKEKADNAANAASDQQKAISINDQRVAAGLSPIPVPEVPTGPQPPQAPAMPTPEAQPQGLAQANQAPALPNAMGDMESMMKQGYQSRLSGIEQQATAQGSLGKEQAESLAKQENLQHEIQQNYQQHYDQLESERQALQHDVQNGFVNPEKFWDNHSKVATGIGIILAGFNPTNSPNAAMNFLKFQMEQNLKAQETNLNSKNNLLSANLRQFGNLKDATDMTRIMQHDMMQNELQQAAAKATSPMAKAAALQAAGQLKMEAAPMFQQFAMRRALMGLAQGNNPQATDQMLGYMRVMNPEMAKEMETRYVPGVGMGSIPIPEKAREQLTSYQQADSSIKDLQQFVKNHNTFIPGTPDYTTGEQKALALQALIRESKLGTVYREGEQPLLDKFVSSNPAGAMKMFKTMPQLTELLSSNMRNYNVLKKQYGLPESKPEAQYKTVGGKRYMRGPNGEAIPVK